MTCATTWQTASHRTGFTLPGMIDEPGCRSGRNSSVSPVRGPEPIHRMSLLILFRLTAMVRSTPDSSTRRSRSTDSICSSRRTRVLRRGHRCGDRFHEGSRGQTKKKRRHESELR